MSDWRRDEFRQVGTDYASVHEVEAYDRRMRAMRDVDGENRAILAALKLPADARVLEIGAGTGAFALAAARGGARVDALDVSPVMLEYAGKKAREENLGVNFVHAGFLSYDYPAGAYDGVVSGMALHHLPDAWKLVALKKIFAALKPGGRFYLLDVVFDFGDEEPEHYFERIVNLLKEERPNLARHIADEYSTLSWILSGLLAAAGFCVESDVASYDFIRAYCCRRPLD